MTTLDDLTGRVISVSERTNAMLDSMFALMSRFYEAEKEAFEREIDKAQWIIIMQDSTGRNCGFLPLGMKNIYFSGKNIRVLYSGNFIMPPEFWKSSEIPRALGKFIIDMISAEPGVTFYWFYHLTCIKSYCFLRVLFCDFFPRFDKATPAMFSDILSTIGQNIFGESYRPESGTVHFTNPFSPKKNLLESIPDRTPDLNCTYFRKKNPGYAKGVELACIAPLRMDNLQPLIRRTVAE